MWPLRAQALDRSKENRVAAVLVAPEVSVPRLGQMVFHKSGLLQALLFPQRFFQQSVRLRSKLIFGGYAVAIPLRVAPASRRSNCEHLPSILDSLRCYISGFFPDLESGSRIRPVSRYLQPVARKIAESQNSFRGWLFDVALQSRRVDALQGPRRRTPEFQDY